MPLFLWLLNTAVVQAYILYKQSEAYKTHPLSHLEFRKQLVLELIGDFSERKQSAHQRGGRTALPPPASLVASAHCPCPGGYVSNSGKINAGRACVVCGKESTRKCESCDVPLCVAVKDDGSEKGYRDCFAAFHKRLENENMPRLKAPILAREAALAGQVRTLQGRVAEQDLELDRLRTTLSRVRSELHDRPAAPHTDGQSQPAGNSPHTEGESQPAGNSEGGMEASGQEFPALPLGDAPSSPQAAAPRTHPRSPVPGRPILTHRSTPPAPPAPRRRRVMPWRGPAGVVDGPSFLDVLSSVATDDRSAPA